MPAQQALEWDKEGDGVRQIRGVDELDSGVTLANPTIEVQRKVKGARPEKWVTVSGGGGAITVSNILVVDARDDEGVLIAGAASQAVQFQLDADADPQPDETDEPRPDREYRVVAVADRSDGGDWVGKVELIIHP